MGFSFAMALAKLKGLPWLKIILFLIPVIVTVIVLMKVYNAGYRAGDADVTAQWQQEQLLHQKAIADLNEQIKTKENQHKQVSENISNEIAQASSEYETIVANLDSEYTIRLRNSEERSHSYQLAAESGAIERQRLASHAAELDRTLEEGRRLVEELRSSIELKDRQLRLLGSQIQADRSLLGATDAVQPRRVSDE